MTLFGDGAEAHRTGCKSLDDLGGRLDLADGNRRIRVAIEFQQASERAASCGVVVRMLRERNIGIGAVGARGDLQVSDGVGIPHMGIATRAPMEIAGIGEYGNAIAVALRIADRMTALRLLL